MLYPTTLPDVLAFQVSVTLCWGAAVPVPLNVWVGAELVALLTQVTVDDAPPEAEGVNLRLYEAVCPEPNVNGKEIPVKANSEPLTLAPETVTGPFVAETLPEWLCVDPTTTFPKLTLDGETAICPGVLPVPERETESTGLNELELTVNFPEADPLVAGLKLTLNVALWPELRVTGGLIPVNEYPDPVTAICEIVTAVV